MTIIIQGSRSRASPCWLPILHINLSVALAIGSMNIKFTSIFLSEGKVEAVSIPRKSAATIVLFIFFKFIFKFVGSLCVPDRSCS